MEERGEEKRQFVESAWTRTFKSGKRAGKGIDKKEGNNGWHHGPSILVCGKGVDVGGTHRKKKTLIRAERVEYQRKIALWTGVT